jgi:hypothetical protein
MMSMRDAVATGSQTITGPAMAAPRTAPPWPIALLVGLYVAATTWLTA